MFPGTEIATVGWPVLLLAYVGSSRWFSPGGLLFTQRGDHANAGVGRLLGRALLSRERYSGTDPLQFRKMVASVGQHELVCMSALFGRVLLPESSVVVDGGPGAMRCELLLPSGYHLPIGYLPIGMLFATHCVCIRLTASTGSVVSDWIIVAGAVPTWVLPRPARTVGMQTMPQANVLQRSGHCAAEAVLVGFLLSRLAIATRVSSEK